MKKFSIFFTGLLVFLFSTSSVLACVVTMSPNQFHTNKPTAATITITNNDAVSYAILAHSNDARFQQTNRVIPSGWTYHPTQSYATFLAKDTGALNPGDSISFTADITATGATPGVPYYSGVLTDSTGTGPQCSMQIYNLGYVSPQFATLSGDTVQPGEAYSENGSFSWTYPDINISTSDWVTEVDYGDGAGFQPLSISGTNTNRTFTLNHTYTELGTYNITLRVSVNSGTVGSLGAYAYATVDVENVPPSVGAITVTPTPGQINSPATISASFTDGPLDTHTATINWGDGATTSGTVSETDGSGTVTGSHTYTTYGNHTITLTVEDNYEETGQQTVSYNIVRKLTALDSATVYISKNVLDLLTRFDLKAEVYKDSTLITSGELTSVDPGLLANISAETIPFDGFSAIDFPSGSVLKIQLYARNACSGSLLNSGTATLYYNNTSVDSQFGATIGATNTTFHLLSSSALGTSSGSSQQTVQVNAGTQCSAYKSFGTWTITP